MTVLAFPQLVLNRPQQVGGVFFGHVQVHVPHDPVSTSCLHGVAREEDADKGLDHVV